MSYVDRPKLFEEDSELASTNPLLTSTLYLKPDYTSPVTLVLTNKSIFFTTPENKQSKKGFMISFDTIFQLLRPKYKPEEKTLGVPYGLKFICSNFEPQ
jgi:hypothetical protein